MLLFSLFIVYADIDAAATRHTPPCLLPALRHVVDAMLLAVFELIRLRCRCFDMVYAILRRYERLPPLRHVATFTPCCHIAAPADATLLMPLLIFFR